MPPTTRVSRTITDRAWLLSLTWMLVFALVHGYWAVGGSRLLPAGFAVRDHLTLLVVDLLAIPLCLVGAVGVCALRPRQPASVLRSRWWVRPPAAFGAALMLAHVASGIAVLTLGPVFGRPTEDVTRTFFWVHEPYWLLGGVLLGLTLHAHGRARGESLRAGRTSAGGVPGRGAQVLVPGLGAVRRGPAERGVETVGSRG